MDAFLSIGSEKVAEKQLSVTEDRNWKKELRNSRSTCHPLQVLKRYDEFVLVRRVRQKYQLLK